MWAQIQVDRRGGLPAELGVEVQPAAGKPPTAQHRIHGQSAVVKVERELIGIPTEQQVAAIGVDRTEQVVGHTILQFVDEIVPGQRRVIGFDIEFEVVGSGRT
jgi:hypothetical protein